MKKRNFVALSIVTLANVGLWLLPREKETVVAEAPRQEGVVFQNDNVVVRYYPSHEQGNKYEFEYDLIVESKTDIHFASEYDMKSGENESLVYLTGRTYEQAKKLYETFTPEDNIEWKWEPYEYDPSLD